MDAPNFMNSPLVVWVQTFSAESISYQQLCDGIFLNEVMQQIDPRCKLDGLSERVEDRKDRLQNWEILTKNINAYYQEVLQQLIVLQPPDIVAISNQPESEASHAELERVLLLVLGCAVQSDDREQFIENIKRLDVDTQRVIVDSIQQVTDSSQSVFPMDVTVDQMDDLTLNLYNHLCTLLHQRESYIRIIKELQCTIFEDGDYDDNVPSPLGKSPTGLSLIVDSSPLGKIEETSIDKRCHTGVELAQCKARLRRLRHELEEKCDTVEELQEELDSLRQSEERLRTENRELLQEARSAKFYRDELDIIKEKATRMEKNETEITRLKERLNEFEFYRARVDELRADNSALLDTNHQLTEQLAISHKRIETVVDLENDLQGYRQQLTALAEERDRDRLHIANLLRENARLEFDRKLASGENCSIDEQLQMVLNSEEAHSMSLMDQLSEANSSQILRLELENQRLKRQLEQANESRMLESTSKMIELEKENSRLSQKVEKLLNDISEREQKITTLDKAIHEVNHTKRNLEEMVETVRENGERHIRELEKEKEHLTQMVETVRERSEKTNDGRILDLERENRKLSENAKTWEAKLVHMELENKQLIKSCERMTATVERLQHVEELNETYELELEELRKSTKTLHTSCEKLESVQQDLVMAQVENTRLLKSVEALQQAVSRKEAMENENIELTVEVQHLKRNIESLKATSSRVADLEFEKEELKMIVRKATEESTAKKSVLEKYEVDLAGMEAQNQHLNDSIKSLSVRIEHLQREHDNLESENSELKKMVEDQKQMEKKVEIIQQHNSELEVENKQLIKDRSGLEKENRKLKQSLDSKEADIDELSSKMFEMESNSRVLSKTAERAKEFEGQVRELEKENLDLNQRMSVDKKTLATLRQDLVNEKIRTQQLSDVLDELRRQVEVQAVKSSNIESCQNDSNYRELEVKMEETFQRRVTGLEEEIKVLHKRLEDSNSENTRLTTEIESFKNMNSPRERIQYVTQRYSHASNPTSSDDGKYIRDQLTSAEKQIARLQDEQQSLKQHNMSLHDQLSNSQSQFLTVQSQLSALQMQYNEIQSKHASVQVENATLSSQNASLCSQNASLQTELSKHEARHKSADNEYFELQHETEALVQDHDALQQLHEHLSYEHETLLTEHGQIKATCKNLRLKVRELMEQNSSLSREMETVAQLKATLEHDKANESQYYTSLKNDYIQLREDNLRLTKINDKLNVEYRDLQADMRVAKSRLTELKLVKDEYDGHMQECNGQTRCMEMELSRLNARCSSLSESNNRLEEENRALMANLQMAMSQNQELLTQLLSVKDQRVEDHKFYSERLAEVQYQKEKLEERMQQCRREDELAKNKNNSFTSNFVRKARQMMTTKSSKERTRTSSVFGESDSAENSSLGSSSVAKSSENLQNDIEMYPARNLEWSSKTDRRKTITESGVSTTPANDHFGSASLPRQRCTNTTIVVHSNTPKTKGDNDDSESISLNQFLEECNKSPKSRRKLLVEKRVVLDDIPSFDRKSDRLLATLPPRSPIIVPDAESLDISRSRLFKSEANVSRQRKSISTAEEESRAQQGNSTWSNPNQQLHGAGRLPTSFSVGDNLKAQASQQKVVKSGARNCRESFPIQDGADLSGRGDAFGSWKVHDVNESRPVSQKLYRAESCTPQWSSLAQEVTRQHRPDSLVNRVSQSTEGNHRRSSASRQYSVTVTDKTTGVSVHSPGTNYNVTESRRPSNTSHQSVNAELQHRVADGGRGRPRSVPAALLNNPMKANRTPDHNSSVCNDDMVTQYEPTKVRQLVQTYQSAFRPVSAGQCGGVTSPGAHANEFASPHQPPAFHSLRSPEESHHHFLAENSTYERSQRRESVQDPPRDHKVNGHRDPNSVPVRSDANVCVVRPATGRALPQPPPPTLDSPQSVALNRPSTPRTANTVIRKAEPVRVPAHAESPSTNKSKPWQEYGCL